MFSNRKHVAVIHIWHASKQEMAAREGLGLVENARQALGVGTDRHYARHELWDARGTLSRSLLQTGELPCCLSEVRHSVHMLADQVQGFHTEASGVCLIPVMQVSEELLKSDSKQSSRFLSRNPSKRNPSTG
jgi:hypothetical protein